MVRYSPFEPRHGCVALTLNSYLRRSHILLYWVNRRQPCIVQFTTKMGESSIRNRNSKFPYRRITLLPHRGEAFLCPHIPQIPAFA
jgi:hypothetical protein